MGHAFKKPSIRLKARAGNRAPGPYELSPLGHNYSDVILSVHGELVEPRTPALRRAQCERLGSLDTSPKFRPRVLSSDAPTGCAGDAAWRSSERMGGIRGRAECA